MTIEEFAAALLERYADSLEAGNARVVRGDLTAGEFEVAAISIIEDAPGVAVTDLDELERLSVDFDSVDREISQRVVAKRRKQLVA